MKRAELKRAVSETENITYSLPACGPEQEISARYGATEIHMGDLNVYLIEGLVEVCRTNENGGHELLFVARTLPDHDAGEEEKAS